MDNKTKENDLMSYQILTTTAASITELKKILWAR